MLAIHSKVMCLCDVWVHTLRHMSISEHSFWGGLVAHWVTALLSMY